MSRLTKSKKGISRSELSVKKVESTTRELNRPHKMICDEEEYELCQKLVRQKLIDCGWSEQIKLLCRDVMREKGSDLTVSHLLEEVSIRAKRMLPLAVKKDLLQKVKEQIQKKRG